MAVGKLGPRSGNWDFLEQHYRDAGFAFETLAFDKRVREIGIVAAMASLPCLDSLANVTTLERIETNPTVGALALLVAEQVRASVAGPTGTLPVHVRTRLASIIKEHATELPQPRFNGFDQELAEQVRAIYRSSNDAFARRNFGTSWQELFPPKAIDHVSADAINELDADQRLQVRTIAGRVVIEALETGLLQLASQRPSC
jgi:hypothetical protein